MAFGFPVPPKKSPGGVFIPREGSIEGAVEESLHGAGKETKELVQRVRKVENGTETPPSDTNEPPKNRLRILTP